LRALRAGRPDCGNLGGIRLLKALAAECSSLGPGTSNACQHALTDHRAFELGKYAHHLKHRSA
jgi:hypothetical protein